MSTIETLPPSQTYSAPEGAASAESILAAAESVQDQVRAVLTYDPQAKLEDMADQRANCIGHTIYGAELLTSQGIDHFVGFVNGHATTIVPVLNGNGETELHLRDMLSKSLNQEVTDAINLEMPEDALRERVLAEGRVLGEVDSRRIGYHLPRSFEQVVAKHPWLSANNSITRPQTRLMLSLFEPEAGRQVLGSYAWFQEATAANDLAGATDSILDMTGVFPDADIRGEAPKQVRSLVKKLALAGDPGKAHSVTEAFYASFSDSTDSRVLEYKADCLRSIAKIVKDSAGFSGDMHRWFTVEAMTLYDRVSRRPNSYRGSVLSKMAICQTMMSESAVR